MKKILVLLVWFMTIILSVAGQTYTLGQNDPKPVKKHKKIIDFRGDGIPVSMTNVDAGIDFRSSSMDKTFIDAGRAGSPPTYSYSHYTSTAYGINQSCQTSIIGGVLYALDSKFIIGDILGYELAYGRFHTTNPGVRTDFFLNHGASWFLFNLKLGAGFMTNFNPNVQYGVNCIFVEGSLDRSYPNNEGRANSYATFRYRNHRILGELTLEGPEFGFSGVKHPQIVDFSCKLLQKHTAASKYTMANFIGLSMEYMNGTKTGGTEIDKSHMLNFKVTVGYIL